MLHIINIIITIIIIKNEYPGVVFGVCEPAGG